MRNIRRIVGNATLAAVLILIGSGARTYHHEPVHLAQSPLGSSSSEYRDSRIRENSDELSSPSDDAPPQEDVRSRSFSEPASGCGNGPGGDDGATTLSEVICGKTIWGAECMVLCAEEGVTCPPQQKHPLKLDGGKGKLWKCCGCEGKKQCKYIYDNGDECTFYESGQRLCKYVGGQ